MAKINVKVIGEGKVEFEGAVYERVTGGVQVGDLAKAIVSYMADVEKDAFYNIVELDADGDGIYYDGAEDPRNVFEDDSEYEIYRKSSASMSELQQRVAELEQRVAELEGGAEVEPEAEPEKLAVGDYAKVISVCDGVTLVEVGDIVKVIGGQFQKGELIYYSPIASEEQCSMFYERFVKATEAEIAEAKREAAERESTAKWAEIGRKPNEFKDGDIVRVTSAGGNVPLGDIGEVGQLDSDDNTFRVNTKKVTIGNWYDANEVELITPVEARFDRESDR